MANHLVWARGVLSDSQSREKGGVRIVLVGTVSGDGGDECLTQGKMAHGGVSSRSYKTFSASRADAAIRLAPIKGGTAAYLKHVQLEHGHEWRASLPPFALRALPLPSLWLSHGKGRCLI